ncbi:MAG TPA: hypothetical protein VGC36_10215 [Rhizomicrobium sp.]
MPSPKERLCHLLELAAQGPSERAALAGEVADLLLDWPAQYPQPMRGTFSALLEKIVREMEPTAALAARFEGRDDFPLGLLGEFFLCGSPAMKDAILARHDAEGETAAAAMDGEALLAAARGDRDFAGAVARIAGIPQAIAAAILADESGRALAALCKGGGIARASFSAMAILAGPTRSVHENFAMLAVFDRVPDNGARRLLTAWRARCEPPLRETAHAA